MFFLMLGIKPMVVPLELAVDSPRVRVVSPTDVTARLREWSFEDAAAKKDASGLPTLAGAVETRPAVMSADVRRDRNMATPSDASTLGLRGGSEEWPKALSSP